MSKTLRTNKCATVTHLEPKWVKMHSGDLHVGGNLCLGLLGIFNLGAVQEQNQELQTLFYKTCVAPRRSNDSHLTCKPSVRAALIACHVDKLYQLISTCCAAHPSLRRSCGDWNYLQLFKRCHKLNPWADLGLISHSVFIVSRSVI